MSVNPKLMLTFMFFTLCCGLTAFADKGPAASAGVAVTGSVTAPGLSGGFGVGRYPITSCIPWGDPVYFEIDGASLDASQLKGGTFSDAHEEGSTTLYYYTDLDQFLSKQFPVVEEAPEFTLDLRIETHDKSAHLVGVLELVPETLASVSKIFRHSCVSGVGIQGKVEGNTLRASRIELQLNGTPRGLVFSGN